MFISILVIVYCVVVLAVAYALKKYQRTILWSAGLLLFIVTMLLFGLGIMHPKNLYGILLISANYCSLIAIEPISWLSNHSTINIVKSYPTSIRRPRILLSKVDSQTSKRRANFLGIPASTLRRSMPMWWWRRKRMLWTWRMGCLISMYWLFRHIQGSFLWEFRQLNFGWHFRVKKQQNWKLR